MLKFETRRIANSYGDKTRYRAILKSHGSVVDFDTVLKEVEEYGGIKRTAVPGVWATIFCYGSTCAEVSTPPTRTLRPGCRNYLSQGSRWTGSVIWRRWPMCPM